jgi:protein involved in polysaccharide export with SLBB domain
MTLADLVAFAGGFMFEADNERIDIARSSISKGQDWKVSQFTTQLPRNFELRDDADQSIKLQPFDHIYVRTIPEYQPQQTVRILGEIKYPGTYPLLEDKERISDLIIRAGGVTGQAFPEGAKLFRSGDSTGLVVIDLLDILQNSNSLSNIVLAEGDVINIPKSRDLVTINGNVNLSDAYSLGFLTGQKSISVAFRGEKSAKYYLDRFAAGVSENGSLNQIKVHYADGRVQKTTKFLVFNSYPKVKRGSTITVGPKPIKVVPVRGERKTDWGTVLRDTMAQATAVLTLLILVDQLSK